MHWPRRVAARRGLFVPQLLGASVKHSSLASLVVDPCGLVTSQVDATLDTNERAVQRMPLVVQSGGRSTIEWRWMMS